MRGNELFALIQAGLGSEAHRHRGVDAPAKRDTAIAGGSYRAPGTLVDGFRAGDGDAEVTGIVVTPRATTAVIRKAADLRANLIISRQAFLGDSQDRPVGKPETALAEKLALIARTNVAILRLQDPRIEAPGRQISSALPNAIGLSRPRAGINLADGLVFNVPGVPIVELVRKIKVVLPTTTVRLVGDPALRCKGVAFATETSRPNALAPLIARPDVNLLVAGEVHETETTAYVLDAITMGEAKALLLIGAIAMEQPAARRLAAWLKTKTNVSIFYVETPESLIDVAWARSDQKT